MGPGQNMGPSFIREVIKKYPDRVAFIETMDDRSSLTNALEFSSTDVFQHTSEDMTLDRITEYGVTTVVLIWWPKIVKKIHKTPEVTVINTHPAYLPYNRGKHPYYWALMEGTLFGATIHRVDDGVDTGTILWRNEIQLDPTDTGEDAYLKGLEATRQLLYNNIINIVFENFPAGIAQDEGKATEHHSSEFELPPIKENESYDGHTLVRDCLARTFNNNHSGRRIEINGKMYRIHLSLVEEK